MVGGSGPGTAARWDIILMLIEVMFWWAACLGVWLLTPSSVTLADLTLAAGCSLICAGAAVLGRRATRRGWQVAWGTLAWLPSLVIAVLTDTPKVLGLPWFTGRGRERQSTAGLRRARVPISGGSRLAATRRAAVAMMMSASPGTYVVDIDPETGDMLLHSLVSKRSAVEEVMSACAPGWSAAPSC